MDQFEVAQILREIGTIIELTDDQPKKGIAYRRAAQSIESIDHFECDEQSLMLIPGIGKSLSRMICSLMEKGYLPYYNHLKNSIPEGFFELALMPGLGTRRIRTLYEKFQVTTLAELEALMNDEEKIKQLGFGTSYINKLRKQISSFKEGHSLLYPQAFNLAQSLLNILKPFTQTIDITGDLRRKLEVIKQIDLIAISKNPEECLSFLANHGLVKEVLNKEDAKLTVRLKQGIQASVYLADKKTYPFTLLATTGNPTHLECLKKEALAQGYELNKIPIIKKEKEIYTTLGLQFIVPELREGYGEVEQAKQEKLPHLIEEKDLKGVFHCHTTYSDGINTIEEMAAEAKELGWEYIGISDHSKSSYQANGMSEDKLLKQVQEIKKLNEQTAPHFKIFTGVECDILKDGQLDYSDDILELLDFVIVSIHRYFSQEEEVMTQRLIKAIENPYTTMVGHLTGRLLRLRDPYQLNRQKIIDACIANDKIIEINSSPNRLDMDWRLWIKAREKGLKTSINTDAHSLSELRNTRWGINCARKGWLTKGDVVNTLSLKKMQSYLNRKMKKYP